MEENFELQAAWPSYDIVNAYEVFMYFATKVGNYINNAVFYVLETNNRVRTKPYTVTFYQVRNFLGKCDRDLTRVIQL